MQPSKLLLSIEPIRGIYEYGLSILLKEPLRRIAPRGDGHPVMVIPGLGTSDESTHYIRSFLESIGYSAHSWGLGRNLGPRDGISTLINRIADRIDEVISDSNHDQVSIIGWSLGGVYAREVAKIMPESIRQVITLGTPFNGGSNRTNVEKLYEFLSKDNSHKDPEILKQISIPPQVPFTSLYSKTDGVVSWECCIETDGECSENIEIPYASHLGLCHNPLSVAVIADRLSMTRNDWRPYHPK